MSTVSFLAQLGNVVSTNQNADILHFNDKSVLYLYHLEMQEPWVTILKKN